MSTNYYLHSTHFPESVHIGASAGDRWTTDLSLFRQGELKSWQSTYGLLACLEVHVRDTFRFAPWVADEYGRVYTPAEAAAIISSHAEFRELDRAFS